MLTVLRLLFGHGSLDKRENLTETQIRKINVFIFFTIQSIDHLNLLLSMLWSFNNNFEEPSG